MCSRLRPFPTPPRPKTKTTVAQGRPCPPCKFPTGVSQRDLLIYFPSSARDPLVHFATPNTLPPLTFFLPLGPTEPTSRRSHPSLSTTRPFASAEQPRLRSPHRAPPRCPDSCVLASTATHTPPWRHKTHTSTRRRIAGMKPPQPPHPARCLNHALPRCNFHPASSN